MQLTQEEKTEIIRHIEQGLPLPGKYRSILFPAQETELVWEGKSREVCGAVLPFLVTERADAAGKEVKPPHEGWTDKLIQGDNRIILSSLIHGPLREEIEKAGGIKLVYIDPPFDSGSDYTMEAGGGERTAYRDTWGKGKDSFLSMLYERIALIHELLAPGGSLFVHCDWHVNSAIRLILDEVFGAEMHRNEIIHAYGAGGNPKDYFPRKHDTIYWYAKGDRNTFNKHGAIMRTAYDRSTLSTHFKHTDDAGRRYRVQNKNGKEYITYEDTGKLVTDVWTDIGAQNGTSPISKEYTGYPTQKPEKLLSRIITAATNAGDLAADFFCGSGTTAAVAMQLGRRWIAADLGRHAIQTTYKRLTGTQRALQNDGKEAPAFEVLTMGKYERLYHMGTNPEETDPTGWILRAYGAERTGDCSTVAGYKDGRAVIVCPFDRAPTQEDFQAAVQECVGRGIAGMDILALEFDTESLPGLCQEAKAKGVDTAAKHIPDEILNSRAHGTAAFHDVHCIACSIQYREGEAAVTLTGFHPCNTQHVQASEDWTELVDWWAVDPGYGSRKQTIHVRNERGEWVEQETGGYVFHAAWRSCRTKHNKQLELTSGFIPCNPDVQAVAVKAVDVYGYETMRIFKR